MGSTKKAKVTATKAGKTVTSAKTDAAAPDSTPAPAPAKKKNTRPKFSARAELKKLKKIVELLPDDRRKISEGLVADAAFMAEQLETLRDYISVHGWSEEYKNGKNQFGKKTSVEADSYTRIQKLYTSTIKQIVDLLPDSNETTAGTEILSFLSGRDD